MVARANAHVRYPCKFILLAAANTCRCGYLSDAACACAKAPKCGDDYLGKLSGPLLDRFDLRVDLPPVRFQDLDAPSASDSSAVVAARVKAARDIQTARFTGSEFRVNADVDGATLEQIATPCPEGRALLLRAADRFGLSARGYHRVLRVARTIADLEGCEKIARHHIAEAFGFRMARFAS